MILVASLLHGAEEEGRDDKAKTEPCQRQVEGHGRVCNVQVPLAHEVEAEGGQSQSGDGDVPAAQPVGQKAAEDGAKRQRARQSHQPQPARQGFLAKDGIRHQRHGHHGYDEGPANQELCAEG